jgi:hypothetical protein
VDTAARTTTTGGAWWFLRAGGAAAIESGNVGAVAKGADGGFVAIYVVIGTGRGAKEIGSLLVVAS